MFPPAFLIPVATHIIIADIVWAAILCNCATFGFFALAQVASELEDPFGEDFYDHPLEHW